MHKSKSTTPVDCMLIPAHGFQSSLVPRPQPPVFNTAGQKLNFFPDAMLWCSLGGQRLSGNWAKLGPQKVKGILNEYLIIIERINNNEISLYSTPIMTEDYIRNVFLDNYL